MAVHEVTQKLLEAKKNKKISFADLGKLIDRDEVWVASLFYRQASATKEEAETLRIELSLEENISKSLTEYPTKGLGVIVPTDPLIYRLYEMIQVYGMPIKAIINEKFGDGIMSVIDFTLKIDKENDSHGDRVKMTMNGKFLPYKKW